MALALGLAALPPPAARAFQTEGENEERESGPERLTREALIRQAHITVDRVGVGHFRSEPREQFLSAWQSLGPKPILGEYWSSNTNASGRVSAIAVDPRDGDVAYVAAAQGGVWKTLDGGASWTPLTDHLSSLASGALALDPSDPDVVYYGTGEQHDSGDSFYGDGMFRSPDGGASWVKIATRAQVGSYIARVGVHRSNASILYVASQNGFVRSTDGGGSWTTTLADDWCYDLALHPTNGDILYTAAYSFGVYKSTDAGATWTLLGGGLPLPGAGFQRINLGIGVSDPQVVYASYVNASGGLWGMYKTTDGGTTWSQLGATPNYLYVQGWYDNCVTVDPTNANICLAGGVYPYDPMGEAGVIRTTNGGTSWSNVTIGIDGYGVHPDQHIFAWGPDGALWLGNDGGVWKTFNRGNNWINCNDGLDITQFYSVAAHPVGPDTLVGGTQDNGTVRYEGNPGWGQVIGGDGGATLFRWSDPTYYYTTYVGLNPIYTWRLWDYAGDASGPWSGAGDRVSFALGPLVDDPKTAGVLYAGTYRVWKYNGASWSAISGDIAGANSVLRSLAVSYQSANTLYAGSFTGLLHRTTDGGANWLPRYTGLPQKAINDLVLYPQNDLTVYIPADTANGGRVWKTTNGGTSWSNITGDLPGNLRALCLAGDFMSNPPVLYVGTDYGVYTSSNDGVNWTVLGSGLPRLAIYDLKVDRYRGVVAATHGRGMWRNYALPLSVHGGPSASFALFPTAPNPARTPVRIDYQLAARAEVRLEVFDAAGRRLSTLAMGPRDAGRHQAHWNGRDATGRSVGQGVFFYRLRVGNEAQARRFVLLER